MSESESYTANPSGKYSISRKVPAQKWATITKGRGSESVPVSDLKLNPIPEGNQMECFLQEPHQSEASGGRVKTTIKNVSLQMYWSKDDFATDMEYLQGQCFFIHLNSEQTRQFQTFLKAVMPRGNRAKVIHLRYFEDVASTEFGARTNGRRNVEKLTLEHDHYQLQLVNHWKSERSKMAVADEFQP